MKLSVAMEKKRTVKRIGSPVPLGKMWKSTRSSAWRTKKPPV